MDRTERVSAQEIAAHVHKMYAKRKIGRFVRFVQRRPEFSTLSKKDWEAERGALEDGLDRRYREEGIYARLKAANNWGLAAFGVFFLALALDSDPVFVASFALALPWFFRRYGANRRATQTAIDELHQHGRRMLARRAKD